MSASTSDMGGADRRRGSIAPMDPHRSHALVKIDPEAFAPQEGTEDHWHLRDYMRIVFKHKFTIISIVTLFTLASAVVTYTAPPIYRATTSVQIERASNTVLNYSDTSRSEYWDDYYDYYQTQIELIKSRMIAERVVDELGMRKNVGAAGKPAVPKEAPAADAAPGVMGMLKEFVASLRKGPGPVAIEPEVQRSNAIVDAFQASIAVEPVRKSHMVRVHYDSTDPYFAARAVNTLAQAFININLERRFDSATHAKAFLEEKLQQTKAKLQESEGQLVNFSRELEIFNIDEKQSTYSQNVQEYNLAFAKAEQERIRADVIVRQLQDSPHSVPYVQDNRTLVELKNLKAKLDAEYQENLRVYKPAFPKMLQLKAQVDEIDKQINDEIEQIRRSASATLRASKSQEGMLKAKLDDAKQELIALQGRAIRYGILKREVDTNRQLYDGLLQRFKEIGVAGGLGLNNISVVDKAIVPPGPYKPDLRSNVTRGLLFGLIVGLLIAGFLEYLDDSYKFADDVERATGAAVLGIVPKLKNIEPAKMRYIALSPHEDPGSAFSESYRSIRTALQFSTPEGAPRRLVVTSSSQNEGKSTSALALAINFAQMGKPVLLIDADMRNPVVHKLMQLPNDRGLSNCLSSNIGPSEVTHRTIVPNLFVMTTGPLPPTPVELLSSTKMMSILDKAEEHFAHVIVDCPPVLGIADAIVLCNQVQNTVFVIESGRTRKGNAAAALKRLRQAGVRPLGIILTKIEAYHDLYGYHEGYYRYAPALAKAKTAEA